MTSSRSCGSLIPETAARKAAAAVEPFAVDTGGGAGQLDIVIEPDDIVGVDARQHAANLVAVTEILFGSKTNGFDFRKKNRDHSFLL